MKYKIGKPIKPRWLIRVLETKLNKFHKVKYYHALWEIEFTIIYN